MSPQERYLEDEEPTRDTMNSMIEDTEMISDEEPTPSSPLAPSHSQTYDIHKLDIFNQNSSPEARPKSSWLSSFITKGTEMILSEQPPQANSSKSPIKPKS
jgi:hypothetical protein